MDTEMLELALVAASVAEAEGFEETSRELRKIARGISLTKNILTEEDLAHRALLQDAT